MSKYDFSWFQKNATPYSKQIKEQNDRELSAQRAAQDSVKKSVADNIEIPDFQTLDNESMQGVQLPQPVEQPSTGFSYDNDGYQRFLQQNPSVQSDNPLLNAVAKLGYYATNPLRNLMENDALQRFSREAGGIATSGASELGKDTPMPSTGNKWGDMAIDLAAMIPGTIVNPGGAPSMGQFMGKAGDVAENLFQKAIPASETVNPLLYKGLNSYAKTAGSFLPFEAANQLADTSDKPFEERMKEIATDSAIGGLLGPAGTLVGKGIESTPLYKNWKLAEAIKNLQPNNPNLSDSLNGRSAYVNQVDPITFDVLRQNEGMNGKYKVTNPAEKDLNQLYEEGKQALDNQPKTETTYQEQLKPNPLSGKFRVKNTASDQLDQLFNLAQERGLPPGREYEYLQNLWSEIAPKDAGTLDELIQKATENKTEQMLNAGTDKLKQLKQNAPYGVNPEFKVGVKESIPIEQPVKPDVYGTLKDLWEQQGKGSLDDLIQRSTQELNGKTMLEAGTKKLQKLKSERAYGIFRPLKVGETETRSINPHPTFEKGSTQIGNVKIDASGDVPKVSFAPKETPVQEVKQTAKETVKQPIQTPIDNTPLQQATEKVSKASKTDSNGYKMKGHIKTMIESEKPADETKKSLWERTKSYYEPITNEEVVRRANERVKNLEEAERYVMTARKISAEHVATAHRLIDEFTKSRNFEKAADIAEKIADEGTKAGQTIQAYSIFNRLSAEGLIVHAKRLAKRTNEEFPSSKPVEVTGDMVAKLTDLAHTVDRMTGVSDASNDVMKILDKAKRGEKLNDIESQTIKNFVRDAKQFINGVDKARQPKAPKPIEDKRVLKNVVNFFDAQEKAAMDRIKARRGRLNAIPVDEYADFAVIGASKLAKGAIKFADWSAEMVKTFGEEIRPQLEKIYEQAKSLFDSSSKKITENTISEAERITERLIKQGKVAEDDIDHFRDLAQKVSSLSGDAKIVASQDLQAVLQQLEKPSIGQRISTLQAISQLWNLKTQARNVIGNELFYRVERLNKILTTPIDWARVQLFGGKRSVTFSNAGNRSWGDYFRDLQVGAKAGWKGVNPEGLTTQFDLHGPTFTGKWNPVTYLEKTLGATLRGFDYAAYKRAVNNTLGEMATLDALNKGVKGEAKKAHMEQFIRNVDENLTAIADKYGKYVTFQDDNVLSKGFVAVKRGLNFGRNFGLGDLVLKYPKTPANLLMRAIEYSPAGFLRFAYILFKPLIKGEPNTGEALMALTRSITGTAGFTGLGYYLADKGIITGASDKDKDLRELEKMSGEGQYQVNWDALVRWVKSGFKDSEANIRKGDKLISYDWAQPVAMAISMGANISEDLQDKEMKAKKDKKELALGLGETAYNSVKGAADTLTQQSLLKGIQQLFQSSPGENGGVTDSLANIVKDAPASFVPTLLNQIKQVKDNNGRITYNKEGLQEVINKLKNKTPGLSETLPIDYDTLGKPKQTYQNNSLLNVFLNPAFTGNYNPSPEAKLVSDLIEQTGDKTLAPRVAPKSITIKGNKYELSPEELSSLQRRMGEETLQRIQRLNPNSNNLQKAIQNLIDKAGEIARKEIERNHPEIQRIRK